MIHSVLLDKIVSHAAKQPDAEGPMIDACPYMQLVESMLDGSINNNDRKNFISHATGCECCRDMLTAAAVARQTGIMETLRSKVESIFGSLIMLLTPESSVCQPIALRGENIDVYYEEHYTLCGGFTVVVKKFIDNNGKNMVSIRSFEIMRKITVYNFQKQVCLTDSNALECSFELIEDCVIVIDGKEGIIVSL